LHIRSFGGAFAVAGLLLFLGGLLSLMRPAGSSRAWTLAVVLVTGADLLYAGYGLNPGAPPDLYRRPAASAQVVSAALQGHRLVYYPADEYNVKYGRLVSFTSFGSPDLAYAARDALLADVSVLDGVASANNFDPLVSARYTGLMQVISATHSLPLMRLMDVAIVASLLPMSLDEIAANPATGVRFYRVPGQPQRVWTVLSSEIVADGPAALRAVADAAFDPTTTVILEANDTRPAPGQNFLTRSSDALTIPVTLGHDGWVILADTYYPGWVAWVDGRPAVIRYADYAFRGVAVPAGSHTIVFDYQPRSVMVGSWLTILGALVGLLLGLARLVYGRRLT
jgi:Bacterial membrane protein YfhO